MWVRMRPSTAVFLSERAALAGSFVDADPTQPVACGGWTADYLLAHLVAQERLRGLPLMLASPVVGALSASRRDAVRATLIGSATRRLVDQVGDADLIAMLQRPPPRIFTAPLLVLTRIAETWVHHEDLRRPLDSSPRRQHESIAEQLWSAVRLFGRRASIPRGSSLTLSAGADRTLVLGRSRDRSASISGEPGELLLFLFGRLNQAHIEVVGGPEVIEQLFSGRPLV